MLNESHSKVNTEIVFFRLDKLIMDYLLYCVINMIWSKDLTESLISSRTSRLQTFLPLYLPSPFCLNWKLLSNSIGCS